MDKLKFEVVKRWGVSETDYFINPDTKMLLMAWQWAAKYIAAGDEAVFPFSKLEGLQAEDLSLESRLQYVAIYNGWTVENMLSELEVIDTDKAYEDLLDDYYPLVKIGCCTFYPSQILKALDSTAYFCGMADYVDAHYYSDTDLYITFDDETFYEVADVEKLVTKLENEICDETA